MEADAARRATRCNQDVILTSDELEDGPVEEVTHYIPKRQYLNWNAAATIASSSFSIVE